MRFTSAFFIITTAFSLSDALGASSDFLSKIVPIKIGAESIAPAETSSDFVNKSHLNPDLKSIKTFITEDIDLLPSVSSRNSFNCVGSIHLGISFPNTNYQLRNSTMEVRWINPNGNTELVSTQPDYRAIKDQAYRTVGIALRRPPSGALFSLIDPSAGMEAFIGEWRAELWIENKKAESLPFEVQC